MSWSSEVGEVPANLGVSRKISWTSETQLGGWEDFCQVAGRKGRGRDKGFMNE